MELGVMHFRSRSFSQKSDSYEVQSKKTPWQPNPEVKAYMKKQELCRKQKKIYENLHKFAEESRRRSQLQKLEHIGKTTGKKILRKKSKSKKPLKKQKTRENFFEKETIQEDTKEDQKSLSLVYDSIHADSESFEHFDLRVPELPKQNPKFKNSESIEKSIENYSERRSISGPFDEDYSEDIDEDHFRNLAATKIQAHVRRFLVQLRIERDQSFSSVDNQVKDIISRWSNKNKSDPNIISDSAEVKSFTKGKKPKPLIINIPSSESDRNKSIFSDSDESSDFDKAEHSLPESQEILNDSQESLHESQEYLNDLENFTYESEKSLKRPNFMDEREKFLNERQNLKSNKHESSEIQNFSDFQEISEKKSEYQEKLKEQLI